MILSGDVGGTKTRLSIFVEENSKLVRRDTERFESKPEIGLEEIVKGFLKTVKITPKAACFGVPGPVQEGTARTTNLPWQLNEGELSKSLGIPKVKLINDLQAVAAAIPFFSKDDLITLYPGKSGTDKSLSAVLAPGTGLGQAFLYSTGGHHYTLASEGGHADLSPNTDIEIELLKYLKTKYEHVSLERVLCGPGLVNIYDFLKTSDYAPEPSDLKKRMESELPAAVISTTGQSGEYEICVKTLDIFSSLLGAQAGNLVLTLMATGGVYLGGGIPPRISAKLQDGTVVKSYLQKGRLSGVVETAPLYIIKDDHAALTGSAHIAWKL